MQRNETLTDIQINGLLEEAYRRHQAKSTPTDQIETPEDTLLERLARENALFIAASSSAPMQPPPPELYGRDFVLQSDETQKPFEKLSPQEKYQRLLEERVRQEVINNKISFLSEQLGYPPEIIHHLGTTVFRLQGNEGLLEFLELKYSQKNLEEAKKLFDIT